MKISLEWLSQYLPGPLDAQIAADALTNGGLPVELIETHGDDTIIDVEVTSNRGDCLSHVGVARELAALLDRQYKEVAPAAAEIADPACAVTSVRIDALTLCPHYTARILRKVRIQPSPAWMVRRLEAIGLRPINNVVDVTNYVMFEMGQPLHAFDFDTLIGRKIIVRTAAVREKIVSIDGHERTLTPDMLVIADESRAVALAGVMGGRDTEVSDHTHNVLLESARFDPLSIRQTARALTMKSDSSYRFERGLDPTLPARASLRAAELILQIAGGELFCGLVQAGAEGYRAKKFTLRLSRLKQVLGTDLPADEVLGALHRLGLAPARHDQQIEVTVPSHRLDLNIEVDLVEEVARVLGYGRIPTREEISIRVTPPESESRTTDTIRSTLVNAGYYEAITFSFVSDNLADDFKPPQAASLPRADTAVRKTDAHLRPSIVPGLLEAVRHNETAGTPAARLFEIGSTFWYDSAGRLVELRCLGLVGSPELREVRGTVESLLNKLDATREVRIVPDTCPGFAAGATGRIEWGGQTVGYLGQIEQSIADKLSLRQVPCAAQIEMDSLLAGAQHVPQLRPLPRFPAVRRDLSLIVSEVTRYEQLDALIRSLDLQWLEDSEYVTTYRGKPLDKGLKSVTVTLVFRSPATTLTSEQVEQSVEKVVAAARDKLHATLRT